MNVRIQSLMSAEAFLTFNPNKWDVIWVRNSDAFVPERARQSAKRFLELVFDDIDFPLASYIMPSRGDVQQALEFCEHSHDLICCCQNGISRSAALAYVCQCTRVDPAEAIKGLTVYRHYPNRRVVQIASMFLHNHEIYKVYEEWLPEPYFINVQNC